MGEGESGPGPEPEGLAAAQTNPRGSTGENVIIRSERAEIEPNKEVRLWAMAAHLSALLALVGMPLGNILGPLIVWLIKRNEMPFVDAHGKEAVNFQITLTIAGLVTIGVLTAVTFLLTFVLIGFLLVPLLAVAGAAFYIVGIVFAVVAAIKANDGEIYRYPMTIRFLA